MGAFIERVCDLIGKPRPLSAAERREALIAFEDTMAVAYAGWHEPVSEKVRAAYRGTVAPLIDGSKAASIEHAALIHATAGHALDYDDVEMTGVTHPSVAIVPALLAVAEARPELAGRVPTAYGVALGVNIAISRVFGFAHYDKGWHATSTIGPVAGAAGLAHLMGLSRAATKAALALAVAQAGGMQRNFGAMAKPLQAGLAASGAVRAALLAEAGVTGAEDAFGPGAYFDLYAGKGLAARPEDVPVEIDVGSISRKLFPCCYLTHRPIAAGLAARAQLPGGQLPDGARIVVTTPFGGTKPLLYHDPQTGLEGKFSGEYTVAVALLQGAVTLADFEDAAVMRPEVRAVTQRVTLQEEKLDGAMPVGIDHGAVRLEATLGNRLIASVEIAAYPGSAAAPATDAEMDTKITDCLALFARQEGKGPTLAQFRAGLRRSTGMETVDA